MRKEKLDFSESLFKAHEILHLPLEELKPLKNKNPEEELKKHLLKFNEFMQELFSKSLRTPNGLEALNYLQNSRKLSLETIEHFGLGYSPKGEEVISTLNSLQKVSPEYKFLTQDFLLQTGQFSWSKNELTHNFKHKITIPIFSEASQIVGFTVRSINDIEGQTRYLHSKETILFKKSSLLYNLPDLKKITKNSFIYLFEGFFDVFSAYSIDSNGIYLALLGSDLSNRGLNILSNLPSKKVVLCLDKDKAGKAAFIKISKQLLSKGVQVYSLNLNSFDGKDLSEIIQKDPTFNLPDPIPLASWLKLSWESFFSPESENSKLITLNQLILSLLDSLFYSSNDYQRILLKKGILHEHALNSVNQIFQLYSIVELTENEKYLIENFKNKYVEAVNLHLLASNQLENQIFEENLQGNSETELSLSCAQILVSLEKISKSHILSLLLQTRKTKWESPLLEKYSSLLHLELTNKERELLLNILCKIRYLSETITPINSEDVSVQISKELFNFLETYYSIIHLLLNKYETTVKTGPITDFKNKVKILDEVENERISLSTQSSEMFQELIKWEKTIKS